MMFDLISSQFIQKIEAKRILRRVDFLEQSVSQGSPLRAASFSCAGPPSGLCRESSCRGDTLESDRHIFPSHAIDRRARLFRRDSTEWQIA